MIITSPRHSFHLAIVYVVHFIPTSIILSYLATHCRHRLLTAFLPFVQQNSCKYMAASLPKYTKALTLRKSSVERRPTYHDVVLESRLLSPLKPGELLIRINAAAFNHKDVRTSKFLSLPRRELTYNQRYGYGWASIPELLWGAFSAGMAQVSRWTYLIRVGTCKRRTNYLSTGVVIASGNTGDPLLNKHVFLTPSRGWEKAPHAPESR